MQIIPKNLFKYGKRKIKRIEVQKIVSETRDKEYNISTNENSTNQKENQSTVSTAKRLAFDCLDNWYFTQYYQWIWNCIYMELEVGCTCMYDKKNADFIFQKLFVFVSSWL